MFPELTNKCILIGDKIIDNNIIINRHDYSSVTKQTKLGPFLKKWRSNGCHVGLWV